MRTIYVVGSVNQDIVATAGRAPLPGETVFGSSLELFAGGKGANQAVAARLLDGSVVFVGKVGVDAFGAEMRSYLAARGLAGHLAESASAPTGTALIVVGENGESSITVVPGANATLTPEDCGVLEGLFPGDLLVLQNEIPVPTTVALLRRAKHRGATTIFNAAPAVRLPAVARADLDVVIVNEHEHDAFFGEELGAGDPARLLRVLERRSEDSGVGIVLTLGAAGAFAAVDGEVARAPGRQVSAVDTTGAGDCFAGALAVALAEDRDLAAALAFANAAASLSVTRMGASASFPTRSQVDAL